MTTTEWTIVGLEMYSIAVSAVLLVGLFIQQRQRTTRLFLGLVLLNTAGLLSDILSWLLMGVPGAGVHLVLRICDFLNHACAIMLIAGLGAFFCMYAQSRDAARAEDRRLMQGIWILCAMALAVTALAECFNIFSFIDADNYYHASALYPLSLVLPGAMLALVAVLTLRRREHLTRREKGSFLLVYEIIPLISIVQQCVAPRLTFAYLYMNVILQILYANIYSEQAKALRDKEQRIAQNRAAAMLSQIKPDFLYDSLAQLEALCLTDPAAAKGSVLTFTRHLRARLDAIAFKEMIPFAEELANTKDYLSFALGRRGGNVRVDVDIGTLDFDLPALTVQSIVETLMDAGLGAGQSLCGLCIASYETDASFVVEITWEDAALEGAIGAAHFIAVRDALALLCGGSIHLRPGAQCVQVRIARSAAGAVERSPAKR